MGNYDAGQTMGYFTTSQIGLNNEYYWSNAQYDKLALQQASAVDPQVRKNLIWQMQQIMYQQSPSVILTYPDYLEAINTAKWTGWTQLFGGTGPAWQCEGNLTSYLDLRPATHGGSTSGGSNTTLIVVLVVVVLVVAGVVFVWVRRRRGRAEDEV